MNELLSSRPVEIELWRKHGIPYPWEIRRIDPADMIVHLPAVVLGTTAAQTMRFIHSRTSTRTPKFVDLSEQAREKVVYMTLRVDDESGATTLVHFYGFDADARAEALLRDCAPHFVGALLAFSAGSEEREDSRTLLRALYAIARERKPAMPVAVHGEEAVARTWRELGGAEAALERGTPLEAAQRLVARMLETVTQR